MSWLRGWDPLSTRVKGAFTVEGERSPLVRTCVPSKTLNCSWPSGTILWSGVDEGAKADDERARLCEEELGEVAHRPLPWPTGPPAPVMFLDAMMFIKKLIAMERVVCFCEVRRNGNLATAVASASAGFEQLQLTKEFDYADKKTEMLPLLACTWLLP